jgi:hypothetical protein
VDDTGAERTRRRKNANHDARLEPARIKLNVSAIAMAVGTLGAAPPGFTQKLLASYPTLTTDRATGLAA